MVSDKYVHDFRTLEDAVKAFDKSVNDDPLDKEMVDVESNKIFYTVRSHDQAGNDTKLIFILFGLGFKAAAGAIVLEVIWLGNSVFAFYRNIGEKERKTIEF